MTESNSLTPVAELSASTTRALFTAGELAPLTTDELRAELVRQLGMSAESLSRMAAIVGELERRGEDLSDLKLGIVHYLRRIAAGQVLPEVVVRFASRPALIDKIASLPLTDQARLAAGDPVRLLAYEADGKRTHLSVDPGKLTPSQVQQVFAKDHIRDESEQVLVLQSRRERPTAKAPARGVCYADASRGGIIVRRTFVPLGDVLEALAKLAEASDSDPSEENQSVLVRMAESDHRRLKVTAAQSDTTISELVRRALGAAGLLK